MTSRANDTLLLVSLIILHSYNTEVKHNFWIPALGLVCARLPVRILKKEMLISSSDEHFNKNTD